VFSFKRIGAAHDAPESFNRPTLLSSNKPAWEMMRELGVPDGEKAPSVGRPDEQRERCTSGNPGRIGSSCSSLHNPGWRGQRTRHLWQARTYARAPALDECPRPSIPSREPLRCKDYVLATSSLSINRQRSLKSVKRPVCRFQHSGTIGV